MNIPIELRPLDVVVLSGISGYPWYKVPAHKLIEWRGLEDAVHCLTVKNKDGDVWSPEFSGIKHKNLSDYLGYYMTIHRYTGLMETQLLLEWCNRTVKDSEGYDFWRQWVLGFVLGISSSISNDPNRWTCSEFPYWAFQENGYTLTEKEELLPMPRFFRYATQFDLIWEGILTA